MALWMMIFVADVGIAMSGHRAAAQDLLVFPFNCPASVSDETMLPTHGRGAIVEYQRRAQQETMFGRLDSAIQNASTVISLDPRDDCSFAIRGYAYARLGRPIKALADLSRAIELAEPRARPSLFIDRGAVYVQLIQTAAALADFGRAIALDPQDSRAYYARGVTRLIPGEDKTRHGDVVAAIKDFDAVLAISAYRSYALCQRGLAKQELGDAKGARRDMEEARRGRDIELAPIDERCLL